MRILMVGAGAAAAVITRALEKTKGNDVIYLARKGRRAALWRVKVLDDKSGELHVRERPAIVEEGELLPRVEQVVLAVRGDQLDDALAIVAALPDAPAVATLTPGKGDLERLRARLGARPLAQLFPAFTARRDGDVVRTRHAPLDRTLVTHPADDASRAFAEGLAAALKAGGLPSLLLPATGAAAHLRDAALTVRAHAPRLVESLRRRLGR